MRERAGVEERSALRVTVDVTDPEHRCLGVGWSIDAAGPPVDTADPKKAVADRIFESARIFLVALDTRPSRTYLGLVDWQDRTSIQLPESLPAGSYAIDVDAYGSASWGDGRLDARGRSVTFTIAPDGMAELCPGGGGQPGISI